MSSGVRVEQLHLLVFNGEMYHDLSIWYIIIPIENLFEIIS